MSVNMEEVRARRERLGMVAPKSTFPFRMPHEMHSAEAPSIEGPSKPLGSPPVSGSLSELVGSLRDRINALEASVGDLMERTKWIGPCPRDPEPITINNRVSASMVIQTVCDYYDVTKNDLFSERRTGILNIPRQITYYLLKEHTPWSLPRIGRLLGGRDHTTVLHGKRKIASMIAEGDEDIIREIAEMRATMGVTCQTTNPVETSPKGC